MMSLSHRKGTVFSLIVPRRRSPRSRGSCNTPKNALRATSRGDQEKSPRHRRGVLFLYIHSCRLQLQQTAPPTFERAERFEFLLCPLRSIRGAFYLFVHDHTTVDKEEHFNVPAIHDTLLLETQETQKE